MSPKADGTIQEVVVNPPWEGGERSYLDITVDGRKLVRDSPEYIEMQDQLWVPSSSICGALRDAACWLNPIGDPVTGIRPKS